MKPKAGKRELPAAEQWLAHAESDLRLGRLGQQDQQVLAEQVCFHAEREADDELPGL